MFFFLLPSHREGLERRGDQGVSSLSETTPWLMECGFWLVVTQLGDRLNARLTQRRHDCRWGERNCPYQNEGISPHVAHPDD